ncbi:phage tail protein, partial [Mesorhizobium sp. M00.F.Ca.ET.149.01.1.1]
MGSIYDWSTTAASNGTADSGINFAEGQAPSTVNDSARQLMGREAEFLKDIGGAVAAGGTGNALTFTANSAFTTLADGRIVAFRAIADNTGAATINVNSLGAKTIRKMVGSGEVDVAAGDIKSGGIFVLRYGTSFNGAA